MIPSVFLEPFLKICAKTYIQLLLKDESANGMADLTFMAPQGFSPFFHHLILLFHLIYRTSTPPLSQRALSFHHCKLLSDE